MEIYSQTAGASGRIAEPCPALQGQPPGHDHAPDPSRAYFGCVKPAKDLEDFRFAVYAASPPVAFNRFCKAGSSFGTSVRMMSQIMSSSMPE